MIRKMSPVMLASALAGILGRVTRRLRTPCVESCASEPSIGRHGWTSTMLSRICRLRRRTKQGLQATGGTTTKKLVRPAGITTKPATSIALLFAGMTAQGPPPPRSATQCGVGLRLSTRGPAWRVSKNLLYGHPEVRSHPSGPTCLPDPGMHLMPLLGTRTPSMARPGE